MKIVRGGAEGWGLHPRPTPHGGENFFAPSSPLEVSQGPAPPVKTLFCLNMLLQFF